MARGNAMTQLGNGLYDIGHHEDALSVEEARLSLIRRTGASEHDMLVAQGNLACTYNKLGRHKEALQLKREVYYGYMKLLGEENEETLAGRARGAAEPSGG